MNLVESVTKGLSTKEIKKNITPTDLDKKTQKVLYHLKSRKKNKIKK